MRYRAAVGYTSADFGVTVLGNSHGFDPAGSTSGFVLWIYGKGVMVDPPPWAGQILQVGALNLAAAIPPRESSRPLRWRR